MIDYKSPIEIWHSEMEMQLEGEVLKACQRVGVNVDRDELLKALKYDRGQFDKGYQYGLNADKWIPCEERLPSESGKYLVTEMVRTALRKYYTVGSSYFNGETWHSDFKGKFGGKDIGRTVIAWQPLPQPYKKEGAE